MASVAGPCEDQSTYGPPGHSLCPELCSCREHLEFEEIAKLTNLKLSEWSANLLLSFQLNFVLLFAVVLDSDLHVIGEFCECFSAALQVHTGTGLGGLAPGELPGEEFPCCWPLFVVLMSTASPIQARELIFRMFLNCCWSRIFFIYINNGVYILSGILT